MNNVTIFKETDREREERMEKEKYKYVPVEPVPKVNLSDLTELKCVKLNSRDDYYLILCEPKSKRSMKCPVCGGFNYRLHGYIKDRLVHDISMGAIRVDLCLKTPRYICMDCGVTFVHEFESVAPKQQVTKRLYSLIANRAIDTPFKALADEYGISTTKVASVFNDFAEKAFSDYKVVAPRVLGIDEKHIANCARGVFVDIENGRLLEMTPNNKKATMEAAIKSFEGYKENIKIVTMDMSGGYYNMIQEILPYAMIVIDKYHVIQDLGRHIAATKRVVMSKLRDEVSKIDDPEKRAEKAKILTNAAKNAYLFKYKEESMPKATLGTLVDACKEFPELNTIRLLKSGFHRIYDAPTVTEAAKRYEEWRKLLPSDSEFDEMRAFDKTVSRWRIPIFNYFSKGCRYTNAATEGLNNLIDLINRQGRGYSFAALRYKCLFHTKAENRPKYTRREFPKFDFNADLNDYIDYRGSKQISNSGDYLSYRDVVLYEGVEIAHLAQVLKTDGYTFF